MIQAKAVGNAVYLEHAGASGDIASWGMPSPEQAEWVATQVNAAIQEAVAEEREACALLAEEQFDGMRYEDTGPKVAAAIRQREDGKGFVVRFEIPVKNPSMMIHGTRE